MLKGTCHCGAVGWTLDREPRTVTACNCTVCRRYGALWAYGKLDEHIRVTGPTDAYRRQNSGDGDIAFHFCGVCGCVTHYLALVLDDDGRRHAAVNTRMADYAAVETLQVRHFEGFDSFTTLPDDGRRVRDLWF